MDAGAVLKSLKRVKEKKMEEIDRMREALEEIKKFNVLRNDIDAYLYEMVNWGLGINKGKPNPQDYFT